MKQHYIYLRYNILCLCLLVGINASAYDAQIGGIFYNFSGNEASVTYLSSSNKYAYSGTVTIPETVTYNNKTYRVTSIGDYAFYKCSDLTSVTIPNSVTSIGDCAFFHCSGLTSVTFGNSVTRIGDDAFLGCSNLTSVTFGNSVTRIGNEAFSYCSNLTSITIPNSVTSIGYRAFNETAWFNNQPDGLVYAGKVAYKYKGAMPKGTQIVLKYGTLGIADGAFSDCSSLTSITIPNSVTNINDQAFNCCYSLISVTIGNSVTYIGSEAFALCERLADVYCYAEIIPETSSSAFYRSSIAYATLHVPASAIEQYMSTDPWSQFGTKKATDGTIPDPPTPVQCAKPTICYAGGKLTFSSETDGAEFISEITDIDIKKHYDKSISLTATYTITVYAIKDGYENSEVATATLCWIDVAPQTEGIIDEDAIAEVKAMPVLIQTQGGNISIQGAAEGTPIAVYDIDGRQHGTGFSEKGCAIINTSLRAGSVAVVKIGKKSVKVLVK